MSDDRMSSLFKSLRADEDPNPAFAETLFNQLQDEVSAPRRSSRTWVLLAAALLVASLAAGAAFGSGVFRIPWLIADADATIEPTPSVEPTPSSDPTEEPTPLPTASPSEPAPDDWVARVATVGLQLRSAPSLNAESLGSFTEGQVGLVIQGPISADGYDWYQFSGLGLPPNTGCAFEDEEMLNCPTWFGWVAGASQDGEPWIERSSIDCPESPMNMQELAMARGDMERLACHGEAPVTVRGWWPELPSDGGLGGACASGPPSGWLYCQNLNHNRVIIGEIEHREGVGIQASIDPESGVTMPERGQWIELVGHFDDPAAQGCDENAAQNGDVEEDPDRVVLVCRTHFVVDAVEPVSGPF